MENRKSRRPRRRDPELERRIEALIRDSGLSRASATQVALGRLELNEVLKKMALAAEVDSLIRRHELSRALATQVALGQADLEAVLFKRRMADHLGANANRSVLAEALESKAKLALALHGRDVESRIASLDRYEVHLESEDEPVHKLQVKWCCPVMIKKKARRTLSWSDLKDKPREPVWKPQDRYTCSNRRLFGYFDRETVVEVKLLEGEIFRGKLTWVGRFEFGLLVKNKVEITVFRHALVHIGTAP
ncbi:MAG: hypothetical protein GY913_08930 [Proteobacteria bacterium]|nr:hypothetical protein [Pseudomonadota bacterium]MCP4917034.1 hypothetical protein [Pseudomonadota bacterium]